MNFQTSKWIVLAITLMSLLFSTSAYAKSDKDPHITQVFVDEVNHQLIIRGNNFDNPAVTLGGYPDPLAMVLDPTPSANLLVVSMPTDILPGDYELIIEQGNKGKYTDDYDLSIGAIGPVGPQGPPGNDGAIGPIGLQGPPGNDGPIGLQGPPGNDGAPGADGADGAPGADGADGAPGADGADGAPGVDGADGAPGVDGADGAPGVDGIDGADGAPGEPGSQGPAGPAGPPGTGSVDIQECLETEQGTTCYTPWRVLTLPISHGLMTKLEAVSTSEQGFETTHYLDITKSVPTLKYPLTYFHTVSYFPYEEVIKVMNNLPGVPSCLAGSETVNPTCKWTEEGTEEIEYSQGFCGNKTVEELNNLDLVFRGEELLQQKSNLNYSYSTGHCARLGAVFFHGYEIGRYQTSYEIEVTHRVGMDEVGVVTNHVVSPQNPLHVNYEGREDINEDFEMRTQLLGDLRDYRGAPEFDNYILYIPATPTDNPYVLDWPHNMLLVPREEVSKYGSELDKVGVSFYAFRTLMGGTIGVSEAGDGLHNQLYHKHEEDLALPDGSSEAIWLLHKQKLFRGSMNFESELNGVAQMPKSIWIKIPDIQYSMLSLSMETDTVSMKKTESIGSFVASVAEFQSLTNHGTLLVDVYNDGQIKADYIVTVTGSNPQIMGAIPAQAVTLGEFESATLSFDIFTNQDVGLKSEIIVTLKSPTGRVYDGPRPVSLSTLKHQTDYSWELLQENRESITSDAP